MRPHGSAERGPPTWHRPLDKGPVIWRNRQTNRALRRLVDVPEQAFLRDLATDDIPAYRNEPLFAQGRDVGRRRKALEESEEPLAAAVLAKAVDLGEVERQMVSEDAVEH